MVKLNDQKIEKQDIEEYLAQYSDFSFEIKVLQKLNELGFECEHSGTYEDPITKKTREFDIRAIQIKNLTDKIQFRFCMAVECKNLREKFPLVVHCLQRSHVEAYQQLIWSPYPPQWIYTNLKYGGRIRLDDNSVYREGDYVGKSCDQVGRNPNKKIVNSDSEVFEKTSQSINSAFGIIKDCHYAGEKEKTTVVSFVLPVLVVPNDRIWSISYDTSGNIVYGPKLTPCISYYIGKSWKVGGGQKRIERFFLSHMEIVQLDSIKNLLTTHYNEDRFSVDKINEYVKREREKPAY